MREPIRDKGRLEHMLEAIGNVDEFTQGISFEELVGNKMLRHAVAHKIENKMFNKPIFINPKNQNIMQKFLRTLAIVAAMLLPFAMQAQNSWTVADGTTTHASVPLDFYNCDGSGNKQAQMLYPASLLTSMNGSTIGAITFYHQNTTANKTLTASTWYIRMAETTETDLSAGLSSQTLTTVYAGNLVVVNGVFSFEFSTPYTYNGGNLIVEIQTSGASGNWFGSSSQGCYGMDNIGSTYSTMSSPNHTAFLPKTTFTEVPSCFPVTNLAIDGAQTTTNSLTLTWTDANNTGATYNIYTVTATDTTLLSNVSATTYTATGLDANTVYTFAVAANCGAGDEAVKSFAMGRTACSATQALPYAETFDGYTGFPTYPYYGPSVLPACWIYYSNGTNTAETSGSSVYYGGVASYNGTSYGSFEAYNPYLYLPIQLTGSAVTSSTYLGYGTARGDVRYAVMPAFATPINGLQIGFDYKMSSAYSATGAAAVLELGYVTNDDVTTFVSMWSANAVTAIQHVVDLNLSGLAAAAPAGARLAFKFHGTHNGTGTGSYTNVACGIDNIRVENLPSCARVTDLTVTGITNSSVTLNWVDTINSGATYTVSDADGVIATGINAMTYTVTGLTANSDYTFSVVTNCSATDNSTATTVSVHTDCDAMTTLPYTQDFETAATGGSTSTAFAECWNRLNNGTQYFGHPYISSTSSYNHTDGGTKGLYWYNTTTVGTYGDYQCIVLPELGGNYSVSDCRVKFWAKASGTSYHPVFIVGVMTNAHDINSFVAVDTVNVEGTTWTEYTVNLTGYNGIGTFVAIRANRPASSWYAYVDDITLEELPSCVEVSDLAVSGITATSITLSWADALNSGATYTVSDANGVIATGITGTTYTVTGLTAQTSYTFNVVANCSATEASQAVSVSATTPCASETMPWSENFDNWTAKSDCWSFLSGAYNMGNGTPTTYSSAWTLNSSYGNLTISGKALTMNVYSTNRYWAVTPNISISSDNAMLSVDVAACAWSSATPNYDNNDTLAFAASTDGGSTWTNLRVLDNTEINALSTEYTTINIPVTGYNNMDVRFAIFAGSSASGGDNRIAIDNVSVGEAPNCMAVNGLTVSGLTSNSVTLSWTDTLNSGATYTVSDADGVIATGVTGTTYTVTELTAETNYTFSVVANCSATDASQPVSVNAFTGYCSPNPTSRDGQGITGVAFGGMTNSTHPSAAPYYGNYSSMAGSVAAGTTANVDITYATGYTYGTIIWVDWNNSLTFEGNEVVAVGECTSTNPTTLTLSFDIPATQATGNYRMRIAGADSYFDNYVGSIADAANASPCFSASYSVAEDYTLTVIDAPSCLPVTGLAASNITTDGATLTWNGSADSYNVYLLAADTTFVQNVTANTITLTGLNANTIYYYGVKSVCGNDMSDMVDVNFHTACGAVAIPYTENFEDNSITFDCWTVDGVSSTGLYNGAFRFYYSDNPPQYLVSPELSGITDGVNVSFLYKAAMSYYPESFQLGYSTTTNAYADFTWLAEVSNITNTEYTEYSQELPGAVKYVAIKYTADDQYYLYIDSLSITAPVPPVLDSCTMTLPFAESFDSTSATRDCWTVLDADGDSSSWSTMYNGADQGMMLSFSYDNTLGALTPDNWLISPKIHTVAGNAITMEWDIAAGNQNYYAEHYGVYVSTTTTDTSAFTLLNEWTLTSNATTPMNIDLSAYAGQEFYVAFRHFNCSDELVLLLDNVNIHEGAYVPDTLTVVLATNDATMGTTNPVPGTYQYITGDTVSFSAVANTGYHFVNWEYTVAGDTTVYTSTSESFAFLATNVMSYGSMTFTANFEADPTCTAQAIPYAEDFSTDYADYCWTKVNCAANTGLNNEAFRFYYNTNPPQYLISPELTGTGSTLQFEFDYRTSGYYAESFMVGYSTTTNDTSAFTWLPGLDSAVNSTYEHFTQVFNASAIKYVAIKYTANDRYYLYIDNVLVRDVPTCAPVTNLTASAVTTTSATLSWTDTENTGATYTVYEDTTVVATGITDTTYTATGLTAATAYTFRVVANCSATDASDAMTVNVTTPCDAVTVFPYTQDFTTMPACWSMIDADGDGFNWEIVTGAIHSASYDNTYGALHPDNWLITPQFQFATGTNYEVTWNANPQDQSWPAEHYGLYVSTTGTNTTDFTLLQEWTLAAGGHVPVVNLSTYAGQTIYLAFRHWNCTDQFRIAIDNFEVREAAGANQITVTLTQNNPMYGSVAGGGVYTIGDSVHVTATPASGYNFARWADTTGAVVSTDNPYGFVATTDITLKAIFLDAQATLDTITVEVNDSTMGTATGGGTYAAGDVATLSATAFTGYHFVNWTQISSFGENVVSTSATFSITVTGNKTYRANFAVDSVPPTTGLTVTFATNNATMGTTNPAPGTYTYQAGDTVWYAATAATGYYFQYWVMTYTYQGQVYNDTSSASEANGGYLVSSLLNAGINHVDMTAYFGTTQPAVDSIAVTYTVNDATMGSINPSGTVMTAVGDYMAATATANDGYEFYGWQVTLSVGGQTLQDTTLLTSETSANFGAVAQVYADYNASFTITALFRILDGINGVTADMNIYSTDNKIIVKGAEGEDIYIYDLNGRTIATKANASETMEFTMVSGGVYMVKVGNAPAKRVLVVR